MKWTDMCFVSRNIIEQCWGITNDNPKSFTVKFGQPLYKLPVEFKHYEEIVEYQKLNPYFDVKLLEDGIFVEGNCIFYSWAKEK